MPVTLTEIPLPAASPDASPGLHGVLAVPQGEGPWPAVVVVHEAFGVTDVMRRQAERLAEAGFLALMPDLFSAGGARRCLVATFRTLAAGEGRAFVDVESARRALLARADCTGRVGVIGFCMGGGFALAAASRGFDASSVNYGMLPEDLDGVLDGACPIVASYGGRDRQLAGSADRLEAALVARGIDHDVREYDAAGHSFLNDAEMGPRALRPVLRAVGMGPEPASAADAWRRIDAFLDAHLHGEERTGA
ncbi:dienelactone hydrolase family protein [Clavibacter michiganensis]|uniref:dienelactone hydrolase family protein n=1 Tax=Clavibacter michiganensis TaxID=28447 RepID=UPI001D0BADEE|nr:dienelactone hydrolase family protein [Clavibacter michiganensis]MDO4136144.1 dienelactone hydrolase family protein [Clavibacter michiganensis]UDM19049.1 dienelactone hydrolase family protein [Clavibacter michiganensis subsp. michiganensis]